MFLVLFNTLILSRTWEQVEFSVARLQILTAVLKRKRKKKKKKKEEEGEEEEEEGEDFIFC